MRSAVLASFTGAVRAAGERRERLHRERSQREQRARTDDGLTLVELLVAFAALILLITVAGTALTTYLRAGTTVISTYTETDQLLPSQIVIQRLIRSQVEPAPTPTTGASANIPTPPFVAGSVGTYSTTFYANVGLSAGPAKIVMAESTPTECAGCKFYTSVFTVTQYNPVVNNGVSTCPFSQTSTLTCSWSSAGTQLVDIPSVVNGAAPITGGATPLPAASTPIFTYNTLDPYSSNYTPSAGGTPNSSGILPNFNSCAAPTPAPPNTPTAGNCPPNQIQSVGVDLELEVQGAPIQENAFTVYRLSSSSFLYSPLIG